MTRHIYGRDGKLLRKEEHQTPVCGQDFCDHCGDCLACAESRYGITLCAVSPDGDHLWAVSEPTDDSKRALAEVLAKVHAGGREEIEWQGNPS